MVGCGITARTHACVNGVPLQLRPLLEPGAIISTLLFLLLYLPIYMLALYIFSYWFEAGANSQGLLQTMCVLVGTNHVCPSRWVV